MSTNPVDENVAYSWKIAEWFSDIDQPTLTKLKSYADEIVKFNKTINLVGPKTVQFIDSLHFADSILASRVIHKDSPAMDHIFDFGSGNGFPGLVFGILYPKVKVTLVDSDTRKVEFLKHMIAQLSLTNVDAKCLTVESLPAESVKFCVSRGFANISKSILLARKCFAKGGTYYHLKSEQWGLEVGEIPIQLCSIWNPALVSEYKVQNVPVKFAVVKTVKL